MAATVSWLKKLGDIIATKWGTPFAYPVEKQKAYIARFPEPKDELERSYFQYCCQMKIYGKPLHWIFNVAALPLSAFLLLNYRRKSANASTEKKTNCIFIAYDLPANIVPLSLWTQYPETDCIRTLGNSLDRDDISFLKTIFKRYPFSWMFWLKVIIKVSQYSDIIKKHSPATIICCDEFSYASAVATAYCRGKGIKRINVMHGEKLYFMTDSFACYDEYYVWNQYYVDLLILLRAEPNQFKIEVPTSLKIPTTGNVKKTYDFTYYLTAETRPVLEKIAASLQVLQNKGNQISIRPHPRHSDMAAVEALLSDFTIEDTKTVSIEESILRTKNAISLYSTVLHQAANNGVNVVIDNISDRPCFDKLEQLQYTMLNTEHTLLSTLVKEHANENVC